MAGNFMGSLGYGCLDYNNGCNCEQCQLARKKDPVALNKTIDDLNENLKSQVNINLKHSIAIFQH